jgi:hypothetical protein
VAWGENYYGQCNVPVPNADFVAVTAGVYHSLGLKSEGAIVAWGDNLSGQCNVPAPNEDFIAVSAGAYHNLGLKRDGTISAWGENVFGQCDVPAPNADFVAVAGCGGKHSLGLKRDGTIAAWGWNKYDQCNVPPLNEDEDFVAVAGGCQHSLGLKNDGTIVAWGWNEYGQCNVPASNEDFIAIAGGYRHSLGLKSDGTILAWGYNGDGQCDVPAPNADFIDVAGGNYHSMGLKKDGTIVAWGWDKYGQCDTPAPNEDFIAIAGGWRHSLGLRRSPTSGSTCGDPEIVNYYPDSVSSFNCAAGCTVSFTVGTPGDYSGVEKITLERYLPELWVEEGSILAPIPSPPWILSCVLDDHYTDGEHLFRAVFHCADQSKGYSELAVVNANRGVAVTITGFESEISDEGVILAWSISDAAELQGFNIYRSTASEVDFEQINERLIPPEHGNEYIDGNVVSGKTYMYRLGAVDIDGEWMSKIILVDVPAQTLMLHQNHPNPFNPSTTISFTLPKKTQANLSIYNLEGKLVKTLLNGLMDEGYKKTTWDGINISGNPVSSGVYFYRLKAGNKVLTRKMMLLK